MEILALRISNEVLRSRDAASPHRSVFFVRSNCFFSAISAPSAVNPRALTSLAPRQSFLTAENAEIAEDDFSAFSAPSAVKSERRTGSHFVVVVCYPFGCRRGIFPRHSHSSNVSPSLAIGQLLRDCYECDPVAEV